MVVPTVLKSEVKVDVVSKGTEAVAYGGAKPHFAVTVSGLESSGVAELLNKFPNRDESGYEGYSVQADAAGAVLTARFITAEQARSFFHNALDVAGVDFRSHAAGLEFNKIKSEALLTQVGG